MLVAVQALPDRQRDAIVLRELEGRSYEEIALALGVTGGAVRQLLNRARNSLRATAAAVTPMPLLTRLASADSAEPVSARVAEMVGVGAAGSGALMAKVCATALVTGAVVGGVAVVPDNGRDERRGPAVGAEPARAAEPSSADADKPDAVPFPSGGDGERAGTRGEGGQSGRRDDGDERAAVPDEERSGRRDADETRRRRPERPRRRRPQRSPRRRRAAVLGAAASRSQTTTTAAPEAEGTTPSPRSRTPARTTPARAAAGGGDEPDPDDPLELPEPDEPDNSGPG